LFLEKLLTIEFGGSLIYCKTFFLQRVTNIVTFITHLQEMLTTFRLLGTSAAGLIFAGICQTKLESYTFASNTTQLGESAYLLDC